jgi:hypothetical protein
MNGDNMLLVIVAEEESVHDRKVEKRKERINAIGEMTSGRRE